MKTNNINSLNQQLEELNDRFKNNLEIIIMLKNLSKDDYSGDSPLFGILTKDECRLERMNIINENFKINQKRIELYKTLKENQSYLYNILLHNEENNNSDYPFIDEWILHYSLNGDRKLVRILQKLKK